MAVCLLLGAAGCSNHTDVDLRCEGKAQTSGPWPPPCPSGDPLADKGANIANWCDLPILSPSARGNPWVSLSQARPVGGQECDSRQDGHEVATLALWLDPERGSVQSHCFENGAIS